MRLMPILLLLPSLSFAQGITTFNNGDHADAATVNANFQYLDSRLRTIEAVVDENSQLPVGAFELRWENLVATHSRNIQLPTLEPGSDIVIFGRQTFSSTLGEIEFEQTQRTRYKDGDAISTPLHVLCDPEIHVAFIPLESSYVIASGPDILALRSLPATESADPENTEASGLCLKPTQSGQYETTLFFNLTIANGRGRFQCAELVSGAQHSYVVNREGGVQSVDLFGIDMATVQSGTYYSANLLGSIPYTPIPRVVLVPEVCTQ